MPIAVATTARVNNSREPVFATCHNNQGNTRRPATSIRAMNAPTCSRVCPTVTQSGLTSASGMTWGSVVAPSTPTKGGSRTSTSTHARSSTTSQPMAMRPFIVSSTPRASRALSSTTVLAQESERPKIRPAPQLQPHQLAASMPNAVASPICTTAPGTAMRFTASRSRNEKCRPTPNISSITPISESWEAIWTSATKPGVAGPIRMPASR